MRRDLVGMDKSEKIEILHPDGSSGGAYSAGVEIDGWLFISGQGPLDLSSGEVIEGSIEQQTRRTLVNVQKILRNAGAELTDVVKCTCHLSNIQDFARFNLVYAEFFPGVRPARTTVQSVLWGGIKVEIDAIARVRSRG